MADTTLRDAAHETGFTVRDLLDRINAGELEARRQGDELVVEMDDVRRLRAG